MVGRTWESFDWIMRAFAEDGEFSHAGRYYDIADTTCTTKPVQVPVPTWYGGMGPRNQNRAAERGMGLTPEQLAAAFRVHPERLPHPAPPDEAFMARIWPMIDRLMLDGTVDPDSAARLAACPTRTLIVFDYGDGLINPVNGRTIKQLMVNSTMQYLFDAGHDTQFHRPEAFADLVEDFLRRGMGFMINDQDGTDEPVMTVPDPDALVRFPSNFPSSSTRNGTSSQR